MTPAAPSASAVDVSTSKHWLLVVGGVMVARLFTNGPLIVSTYAALMIPLGAALGVDRGTLSLPLSAHLMGLALSAPLYGMLIDRFGVRRVVVPSLLATGIGLALVGLTSSLPAILTLYAVMGLIGAAAAPTAWGKLLVVTVKRHKGLVLSCMTVTGGVGGALAPLLVALLLGEVSWRGAYVALGVLMIAVTVPILLFVTPDTPRAPPAPQQSRLTAVREFGDILKRPQFWAMIVPALIIAIAASGKAVHFISMMVDRDVVLRDATAFNVIPNALMMVTAVVFGFFIDRFHPMMVGTVLCLLSAVGFLLMTFQHLGVVILGSALAGCAGGAEIGLIGYICTRYFPPKDFGKTYGVAFLFWAMGQSFGAYLFGLGFDFSGSYLPCLVISAVALAIAPLFLRGLGPFLYPIEGQGAPTADAETGRH